MVYIAFFQVIIDSKSVLTLGWFLIMQKKNNQFCNMRIIKNEELKLDEMTTFLKIIIDSMPFSFRILSKFIFYPFNLKIIWFSSILYFIHISIYRSKKGERKNLNRNEENRKLLSNHIPTTKIIDFCVNGFYLMKGYPLMFFLNLNLSWKIDCCWEGFFSWFVCFLPFGLIA